MSFASLEFVAFFAVVFVVTLFLQRLRKQTYKELFLLFASYFFYGYWDWRFAFLLLFVSFSAYISALFIHKKASLVIGIIIPLVVLGFFKYFNFFLSSFSILIGGDLGILNIILPVGISFYTFQSLSYVIDVKRKKIKAEKNFIRLALYISFFPQLVAGPIVKASEFLPQLDEDRRITRKNMEYGIQLMLFGFFKKIVIADHLSVFVDDVFKMPTAFHWLSIILAVISYSIQIYFDFSGYSDIAIGCAKCFGYDFCPNFNLPYLSENVTVFWRRWHISLSTWLKEYLYIPLGGNRKGKIRQYINLFVTMLLGGLWHGANWTFVFWGAMHGLALCVDKLLPKKLFSKGILKFVGTTLTFSFVTFLWIFFRADNFEVAWHIIKGVVTLQGGILQPFSWSFLAIAVVGAASALAIYRSKKNKEAQINGFYPLFNLNTVRGLTILFIEIGSILCLGFTGEHPFVYFQF
ncbi:MAG: MBOAT family protein [Ruminococcaceae bacterium]|nr:MBOAT family protein [Oscillospiraceae bacterium]